MKLYEFAPTRSIRARWTLQELGVPFEAIKVNWSTGENRSPEFLKLNPARKVPVLVDGDVTLSESIAIVTYLGEKYADKGFVPRELGSAPNSTMAHVRRDRAGAAAVAHREKYRAISRRQAPAPPMSSARARTSCRWRRCSKSI